jgi:TRAP-type mannitol/chloroaromatic compound transport system permease large subunit
MTMTMMAPTMFGALILFMVIGFPVAFSLAALGFTFAFWAISLGFFKPEFMTNIPLSISGVLANELLLSIPFFTFMGAILERCGLAEDLLEGTGQLFGSRPGGIGYAVIIVGAILGAITGTVAASVIAMGVISLPVMLRYGYNQRFATGVIAASTLISASGVGGPDGQVGRRYVQGSDWPLDFASVDLSSVCILLGKVQATLHAAFAA